MSVRAVPRLGRCMTLRMVDRVVAGMGLKTVVPVRRGTSVRRTVAVGLLRRGGLRTTVAVRLPRRMLVPRAVVADRAVRCMLVPKTMAVDLLQRDALVLVGPARRSTRACRTGPVPVAAVGR